MELKVRVDGISRIVCGVTENTTCQDVVIALAHAMGRTGTFTLIEKWRDNERPLNKAEFPVKVLQKWGEYANEVQLLLQQSDQSNKQSQQENLKEKSKSKDNFKHNFTPPPQKEGPVRRSLTFSGAHNVAFPAAKRKEQPAHKLNSISEKENIGDKLLTQSLPSYKFINSSKQTMDHQPTQPSNPATHGTSHHPYAQVRKTSRIHNQDSHIPSHQHISNQVQQSHIEQRAHNPNRFENHVQPQTHSNIRMEANKYSHYNGESFDSSNGSIENRYSPVRTSGSPVRKSPSKIASPVSPTDSRGQSPSLSLYNKNRQSAFSPVIPRQKSPNSQKNLTNGDLDFRVYSPENEQPDIVEYDLDSTFPDLYSKQRQNHIVEEYCMPGENVSSPVQEIKTVQEDSEFIKMQELITRQQERIKHQESQLELINSEITTLEKRDVEQAKELMQLSEEKQKLEQKQKQFESELSKLEPTKWVDLVQAERQAETKIRSEIIEFKSRTTKVGMELKNLQSKLTSLEKGIKTEKADMMEEKNKKEEEEKKLQQEVEKLKTEVQTQSETIESDKQVIDKIEIELKEINEELDKKKKEYEELEKELKDENMKDFKQVVPMGNEKGKPKDSSGEVVLKVLEGRKSPNLGIGRKIIASPLSKVLSVSKNPNGVWV